MEVIPMYEVGTKLQNHVDFDNCIYFRLWVQIQRLDGFIVDPGGFIESHNATSVIINAAHFIKERWNFVVSEKLESSRGDSFESH